jgi:hypothetical protein
MNENILILNPVASVLDGPQQSRQPLDTFAGKVIGFVDNAKPNFNHLVDDLAELLVNQYGAAAVIKRCKGSPSLPAPDAMMQELYEQCDAVITGSGD